MDMNILVLDDAPMNVALLCHLLSKIEHCKPVSFLAPEAALAWCEEQIPDVVMVDFMMPGMDGVEFIRRFRCIYGCQDIPILMITANDEVQLRYQALDVGANDFLIKPIDKIEFLARTKNMLALRKNQRFLQDRAAWLDEEVRKATAEIRERERETYSGCLKRQIRVIPKRVPISFAWPIIRGLSRSSWVCPRQISN